MIRVKIAATAVCFLFLFLAGCKKTPTDNSKIDVNKSSGAVSTTAPEDLSEEDGVGWDDTWGNGSGISSNTGSSLSTTVGSSGTSDTRSQGISGNTSGSKLTPKTSGTTVASSQSAASTSSKSGTSSETSGTVNSPEDNGWTPNY